MNVTQAIIGQVNPTYRKAYDAAEAIRQGFRDGSIVRKASTMIREQGVEREDAERQVIVDIMAHHLDD